jgi:deazaflavin-dependent oxidoreductase (nitroreductase family)
MSRQPAKVPQPRLGRRMARFNRAVTNRVTTPFAGLLPGFGIVVHTGRRSGRTHRTPVNVFRARDGFVVALTYGTGSQWVRNVRAAGGCEIVTRGRRHVLTEPRVIHDERRRAVPPPVRIPLALVRVSDFMHLREVRP